MRTLKNLHRRSFLRGMVKGSAVVVALPLLDVFLDPHGEALAKDAPEVKATEGLPICFGTWYWPLGLSQGLWEPKETGPNFKLSEHLQALAPIMGKFNVFSGTQVLMDGKTIIVHYSSVQAQYSGIVSTEQSPSSYGRSLDQNVAAFFGNAGVVIPSVTVTCDGNS